MSAPCAAASAPHGDHRRAAVHVWIWSFERDISPNPKFIINLVQAAGLARCWRRRWTRWPGC